MATPTQAHIHALITQSASGKTLTAAEIRDIRAYIAQTGFTTSVPLSVAGGRLTGLVWQGRVLAGSDRLTVGEVHYLRHCVRAQEWPAGTTFTQYIGSLRRLILDDIRASLSICYSDGSGR